MRGKKVEEKEWDLGVSPADWEPAPTHLHFPPFPAELLGFVDIDLVLFAEGLAADSRAPEHVPALERYPLPKGLLDLAVDVCIHLLAVEQGRAEAFSGF